MPGLLAALKGLLVFLGVASEAYRRAYVITCGACGRRLQARFTTYLDDYTVPSVCIDREWCASEEGTNVLINRSSALPEHPIAWTAELRALMPCPVPFSK